MCIREKIDFRLNELGIKQKDLCEYISMTPNGFRFALKNKTIELRKIEQISQKLNVSMSYFFEDAPNSSQNIDLVFDKLKEVVKERMGAWKTFNFDDKDVDLFICSAKRIVEKYNLSMDQALKVLEVMVQERFNDLYHANGDIFDEQMEGIGEILLGQKQIVEDITNFLTLILWKQRENSYYIRLWKILLK